MNPHKISHIIEKGRILKSFEAVAVPANALEQSGVAGRFVFE